ncbi:glycosyl hydrolase [Xylaria arbuscula]|nr:glycosyl hydrolase [Xylaria arbuscula]
MKSVVVANNKVTLTPTGTDSYFYSQLGCFDARDYGGISLRITAAKGTTFDVQLSSSKDDKCDEENTTDLSVSSKSLGWTFDGTEQLYSIPFTKYAGLDYSRFGQFFLSDLSKPVTLGPVALYCGKTVAEYVAPPVKEPAEPTGTVAAPTATAKTLVIDTFASKETNALGQWHGSEDDGLTITYSKNTVTLKTNDSDLAYVTQVSPTCLDMTQYDSAYLHLAYSGSSKFTISLQQHNAKCDNDAQPYPETWDSLEAARYATDKDIYIPLNHFAVNRSRVIGLAIKGLYTLNPTTISKIEVVDSVPASFKVPVKLPTGSFIFACTRPNSFAFAIDDGDPQYAQYVMSVIEEAGFKATFFTVGAPLLDPSTNLSNVYLDMKARGHQIALHSYTHPPLEGLPDEASIDWEYTNDLAAVDQIFGTGQVTKYFRPPFGNEGARMRQRYAALVPDPYIMQWSVDVEDWLWAETDTPEKQIDAFKRDVTAGGTITVMHYLYNSTVSYLPQFIEIAKATGKQLMRIDQCMEDPNAPPL